MNTEWMIGVRYCGGCNSRYDRVAVINRLKKLLPETVFQNAVSGENYDAALIVSGCGTRCTKTDDLTVPAGRMLRINGFEDLLPVRDAIKLLYEKKTSMELKREDLLSLPGHRGQFMLIEAVDHLIPGEEIKARLASDKESPLFPASLLIEAMAQAAFVMLTAGGDIRGESLCLTGVGKAAFLADILPDSGLSISASLISAQQNDYLCKAQVLSESALLASAEISFSHR